MEQLDSVCFDLWVAGMETTSNTLYWSLLYVLLNPKVLEKVYEELDAKIGNDRIITTSDRPNLNCISATINMSNYEAFTEIHTPLDPIFHGTLDLQPPIQRPKMSRFEELRKELDVLKTENIQKYEFLESKLDQIQGDENSRKDLEERILELQNLLDFESEAKDSQIQNLQRLLNSESQAREKLEILRIQEGKKYQNQIHKEKDMEKRILELQNLLDLESEAKDSQIQNLQRLLDAESKIRKELELEKKAWLADRLEIQDFQKTIQILDEQHLKALEEVKNLQKTLESKKSEVKNLQKTLILESEKRIKMENELKIVVDSESIEKKTNQRTMKDMQLKIQNLQNSIKTSDSEFKKTIDKKAEDVRQIKKTCEQKCLKIRESDAKIKNGLEEKIAKLENILDRTEKVNAELRELNKDFRKEMEKSKEIDSHHLILIKVLEKAIEDRDKIIRTYLKLNATSSKKKRAAGKFKRRN